MNITRLAEKLSALTAYRCGSSARLQVPLHALSVACLLGDLEKPWEALEVLSQRRDAHFYGSLLHVSSCGRDHAEHLDGWIRNAEPETVQAYRDCLAHLATVDLVEPSWNEDILGSVYGELRSKYDRSTSGAFYTPLNVARLVAALTFDEDREPGSTVYDPACGSGTMLIGVADVMREHDLNPKDYRWHGQDLDGIACALTTVNLVYRGIVEGAQPRDLDWLALKRLSFTPQPNDDVRSVS